MPNWLNRALPDEPVLSEPTTIRARFGKASTIDVWENGPVEPWSVYLARPMDFAGRKADWAVEQTTTALEALGALVYDPGSWGGAHPPRGDSYPQRVHNAAIDNADACVAILLEGVQSVGVPVDLARAAQRGVPTVVLCDWNGVQASPVLASLDVETVMVWRSDGASDGLALQLARLRQRVFLQRIDAGTITEVDAYNQAVAAEVERARQLWPHQTESNTSAEWFAIWVEEAMEAIQAWVSLGSTEARTELIQCAAMGMQLWASIGRAMDE